MILVVPTLTVGGLRMSSGGCENASLSALPSEVENTFTFRHPPFLVYVVSGWLSVVLDILKRISLSSSVMVGPPVLD